MLLYKVISSAADYVELQQDIDQMYGWSAVNLMTFNFSNCKCMLVSRKRNANCPPMNLNNHQLEQVQCYKYLGLLSTDLSWSHHIETTCTNARKLLGLLAISSVFQQHKPRKLWQNSICLLSDRIWNMPLKSGTHIKDKNALESVQKFGL